MTMTLNLPQDLESPPQNERAPAIAAVLAPAATRGEVPLTLTLRHGGEAEVTVRYELLGHEGAPLLIVAGGISAGRHVLSSAQLPEPGWWEAQANTFDLSRFRILAIDWVGADGLLDAAIDPADQAEAIVLVLNALGLGKAAGFIGASYGGMVGMHLAARHPGRIGALLAMSAAGFAHPYSSACRSLQRRARSVMIACRRRPSRCGRSRSAR